MPSVKTIKGVNEESWLEFKSLAARNNMKMGKLFEEMVEEYKRKAKDFWDDILKGPALLTEEEAKAMEKVAKSIRKEYGFRNAKWQ